MGCGKTWAIDFTTDVTACNAITINVPFEIGALPNSSRRGTPCSSLVKRLKASIRLPYNGFYSDARHSLESDAQISYRQLRQLPLSHKIARTGKRVARLRNRAFFFEN